MSAKQAKEYQFMKTRRFPGKLFLLGEYFVTRAHSEGIVIAVDRFIETKTKSSKIFNLKSDYGQIVENHPSSPDMNISLEAVLISYEYLDFLNLETKALDIEIISNLLENGQKIGLGSSGVVIVAIIQTILESHHVYLDKLKLFKLSVLCQKRLGDLSSGGDLAASIYSGIVYYKKYDQAIITDKFDFESLDLPWPGLKIKKLDKHNKLEIMVGWTKKANKTDDYLKIFNQKIIEEPKTYEKFAKRSQDCVKMFLEGQSKEPIFEARKLMLDLEIWTDLDIETSQLKQAIELALKEDAYAKVSGSGGGDCMIAINIKNKDKIIESWKNNHIKYLDIGVWNNEPITKKR